MRSFVFFAAFLTTVSALCNVTDMSNYQLNSAGKGADEVWRLVIFVERDVPSHQIKIQAKFVELLLCRLSAAGGIFELRLYPLFLGKCDDCENRHVAWNEKNLLQKVGKWFTGLRRSKRSTEVSYTVFEQFHSILDNLTLDGFKSLSNVVVFDQKSFEFIGNRSNYGNMSFYSVNFFDKGSHQSHPLIHQVFFESFQELRDLMVFLRSEVPQLKKLSDAIIRRTNNYERNATLRWGLLQPIDGMLIPPISTAERIQLAFFDVLVFLFAAALVYTSLASSYLVGLQHLEIIRSFNALAHLNRRIRHEV
ncbi:hypothetical protein QR680_012532 [Steinernema hermaphroditum]|uniref:Uncharacterized protein n=1 Tax=Steinernema hermaphroditum TaxID=289476 RepID=A0AA39M0W4_9BILA|nr:hypothetical protein QR680_012532 [Steinernema hermaphroditum]